MEKEKAFADIFKAIDGRRDLLYEMVKRSQNEVAIAILHLTSEVCELEKLILSLLMKYEKS